MKTLKRLKNLLSGEENKEEEKTETPQGETEKTITQTTIKEDNTKKPSEKPVKTKAEEITEDIKSDAGNVKSEAEEKTEEVSQASKTVEKEEKPAKSKTDRSGKMTLLEGREEEVITRKNIDPDFKQEIMDAGAESVALCFQCGTCTGADVYKRQDNRCSTRPIY